jgi:protein phosphatase
MIEYKISAASSVGCVRDNNEDMLLIDKQFVRDSKLDIDASFSQDQRYLLALADGMGGHNCGEVASSDTLHNLQFYFNDIPTGLDVSGFNESIYEWLVSMNNTIEGKGNGDAQYKNMGTTLVSFVYYGHEFFWMNCGDSRLYRLHEGKLTQLTTDHSLSNMLGQHAHSHIITNCIGGGCKSSYIDIVKCTSEVAVGDTFLLCSDGLTDMLSDSDIENMMNAGYTADRLCVAAERAGGLDNVSVILAHIVSLE